MNDTAAVSGLTHLDAHGKACMVDVSGKAVTVRSATATAQVRMRPETLRLILTEGHKNGDVLAVARIAGIQAAKRCAEMIPLCHPLLLSSASIEFNPDVATSVLRVLATRRIAGPDGRGDGGAHVASVAALTIYDMCKAVDRGMVIGNHRLLEKTGDKSGEWRHGAD